MSWHLGDKGKEGSQSGQLRGVEGEEGSALVTQERTGHQLGANEDRGRAPGHECHLSVLVLANVRKME